MQWQILTCVAHLAVALRAGVTTTEHGALINCTVDGTTVFTQTIPRPEVKSPQFKSEWTNADDTVTATVSGLFEIVGTFQRSNQYNGTLTVTSATIEESVGVPKKMIEGVKKWTQGVVLTVKFGLTTAQITGENVFMEFSNGKIKKIAYGDLVDCKVDGQEVYAATTGQYPARMVWFDDSTVVAVVDGLYTITGKYTKTEVKDSFTVTSMTIVDNPDPDAAQMVEGLRKWTAGVELSLSRDDRYSFFSGAGVQVKYARMVVMKGDLMNCRRGALPIYQKEVGASYKYRYSWVQKPNNNDDQIVTMTVDGLCRIVGKIEATLDNQNVGLLTVSTITFESSVDADAENMLGGIAGWTSGDVLNVVFGATTLISGHDIQLEFRHEV